MVSSSLASFSLTQRKMSSFILLSVLFLILQSPLSSLSNSEGDALYAFKNRLSDPGNVLQSWDSSLVDPCTWLHVTCDSSNSVIRLALGYYNLAGTLGPELGQLPNLQYLELYENKLSGNIPEELGNLQNLVSMDLYSNQLEGNIPKSFGNLKSLKFLRVNNNNLAGIIPIEVIRLNLQVFDYYNTRLSKPPVDVMASLNHSGRKVLRNSTTKRSKMKELVSHESSDSKEVIYT